MIVAGTHDSVSGREIAIWFGQIVGKPQFGPYQALGWKANDGLRSAVLLNDYNGSNIELHMVGELRRPILRTCFRYAFNQLKVHRITAKPYRCAVQIRLALVRLGFEKEAEMKRYYGSSSDDDAIVYRLDRHKAEKWMA